MEFIIASHLEGLSPYEVNGVFLDLLLCYLFDHRIQVLRGQSEEVVGLLLLLLPYGRGSEDLLELVFLLWGGDLVLQFQKLKLKLLEGHILGLDTLAD